MVIKKSFGGQTIRKPGAYSQQKVDNSAGASIGTNDTLMIVGEATLGAPGATEGIQEFRAEQIDQLINKYGSGPIVDAAVAARNPSRNPGLGGAGRLFIWKTNASTQASLSVNEATDSDPLLTIKDPKYGQPGNNISATIANGSSGLQKTITINKLNETAEALGENTATAQVQIQYTGDASTAVAQISGASRAALTLATTLAGDQGDGSANLSISLANYTMKELADFINTQTGYAATLQDVAEGVGRQANELDPIASTDIKTAAVDLYRLQNEIIDLINEDSVFATAELAATPVVGLPVNITNAFLTGGALGASTNSNFSTGFAKSLAKPYNVLLPVISQDATDDISDGDTDASSTYTIASVLAAADSHLRLRGSIKNAKEAQGMGGVRKSTKAAAYAEATGLASELMQIAIQDVRVNDVTGNNSWKKPHIKAALLAGIRLGTEVGEPLTHKRLSAVGIGHYVDPATGLEGGDFNPDTDFDVALDNGVIFSEQVNGGIRVVADNTTYGADQSFVFNRGSVMEAAQFIAKDLRTIAEELFVGKKVANGTAQSIKAALRNRLRELNAPEVNITTGSADAPEGFVEETFVVEVTGNTARVQVEVKPVQGLDFVFITFTLGDIQQTA